MREDVTMAGRRGVIARYGRFLPLAAEGPVVTLGEGDTPLVRAALARELGIAAELYLKYEGANPTGSFKDRGMTVAVTDALRRGATAVICASTGNTSASVAACTRPGPDCAVSCLSRKARWQPGSWPRP